MHYLIFIPKKQASNRQHLLDAGLGDLIRSDDDMPMCGDLVGPGPGNLPGQIWAWGDAIPAYLPDRQTWTPDKKGRYWFGVTNGHPPTSADLQRRKPVDGLRHVLGDKSEWIIPSLFKLPAVFDLDDAGELTRKPHQRFEAYVDECNWALGSVIEALEQGSLDWRRAFDFVVSSLSINYRINREIAVYLGLIEEAAIPTLMAKATDAGRVMEVMSDLSKKKLLPCRLVEDGRLGEGIGPRHVSADDRESVTAAIREVR